MMSPPHELLHSASTMNEQCIIFVLHTLQLQSRALQKYVTFFPMQLFMWQRDIEGVAHYIMDYFEVFGALDAPDNASTSSSSTLPAG